MNEMDSANPTVATGIGRPARTRADYPAVIAATVLAILFWEGLVLVSGGWVPGVLRILSSFVERLSEWNTYVAIAITLSRIGVAFLGAFLIGVALGVAMGLWDWVDAFWRPIVALALAIPDPVYFIMAILVFGTSDSVSVLALMAAVLPFAVSAVAASMRARDSKLDDMARAYRLSGRAYFHHVLMPQIAPAILVSARTAFAFSWKIGVLMEAMTRPNGIGAEIFFAFRLFRPHETIALALIFILVKRAIELLVFAPIERRASAWRL
jgi:NitT/TauT family transport system permease protein